MLMLFFYWLSCFLLFIFFPSSGTEYFQEGKSFFMVTLDLCKHFFSLFNEFKCVALPTVLSIQILLNNVVHIALLIDS